MMKTKARQRTEDREARRLDPADRRRKALRKLVGIATGPRDLSSHYKRYLFGEAPQ